MMPIGVCPSPCNIAHMLTELLFLLKKIVSALILPPPDQPYPDGIFRPMAHQKAPKAGRTLGTVSLTALLILSLPVTGNALLQSLETVAPINETQLNDIQAIVILGGGKNNEALEFSHRRHD